MDVRLFEAVMAGEVENLHRLLDSGGKLKAKDHGGSNLLHAAVAGKQMTCAKLLVQLAPQLASEKNGSGRTPLLSACQPILGLDIIRILVQVPECLDIPDDDAGQTPLHHVASDFEGLDATRFLLDCGADINAIDRKNMSVLHLAVRSGNINTVKLLLEREAEIGFRDFMQVNIRQSWSILKLLLEHKPEGVNTKYPDGYSLLMRVARFGDLNQVKEMLDMGADFSAISENGTTALMEAVKSDDPEVVKLLLDKGADPLVEDKKGRTILSIACKCPFSAEEMLQLLFKQKQFTDPSFKFSSLEVHPQSIILRKKRSPKLLKLIINSQFKDENLIINEDFMNMNLFKIFDSYNMCLGPISYLLHNPESHLITDNTTLELLEILVEANYPVNTYPNSIQPLTILLSCDRKEIDNIAKFMRIFIYLIENGAQIGEMCLKIITSDDDWPSVEVLRQKTHLPDALLMAFLTRNIPAIEFLLPYWSAPPLALLLLDKKMCPFEMASMYPRLVKHGLPLGTPTCTQLSHLLKDAASKMPPRMWPDDYWTHFQNHLSVPPSLKELSKFAVRAAFSERGCQPGHSLLGELRAVCPPGLKTYLLMKTDDAAPDPSNSSSASGSPTKLVCKRRKL